MFIINDIGIYDYTLFKMGGYLIYLIIIIRTILNKYIDDYKIFEYIATILINFIAIGCYSSEYDGMLYVALLVILTIGGYIYKMGPVFIVSAFFILFNVFLLTRNFWLSIPWWLYVLFIGSVLIVFAIYNELNDKKDKNINSKIQKLKN